MTDSQKASFLENIANNPDNDEIRLVYSDYLIERGDPRGEFIAVQIALEQARAEEAGNSDERIEKLRARETQLWKENWWKFAKEDFYDHLTHDQKEKVQLKSPEKDKLIYQKGFLYGLNLSGKIIGPTGAETLASSETFKSLGELNLEGNQIGAAGVKALANSETLRNLKELNLKGTRIGASATNALKNSEILKSVAVYL